MKKLEKSKVIEALIKSLEKQKLIKAYLKGLITLEELKEKGIELKNPLQL